VLIAGGHANVRHALRDFRRSPKFAGDGGTLSPVEAGIPGFRQERAAIDDPLYVTEPKMFHSHEKRGCLEKG